jgi:hypothetical protein
MLTSDFLFKVCIGHEAGFVIIYCNEDANILMR